MPGARARLPDELDPTSTSSAWPTRMVVVLATLNGTLTPPPLSKPPAYRWLHDPERWCKNTSKLTFIVYQRVDRSKANFSPNYGFEAGVIVQFILDHYHALPDQTIFMQDRPEQHNPQWYAWTNCLLRNVSYAPFAPVRLVRLFKANAQTDPGTEADNAIVEQCWRDFLDVFNAPVLMPREVPNLAYFQGAMFVASRQQLRNTASLHTWRRAHGMLAGGDGRLTAEGHTRSPWHGLTNLTWHNIRQPNNVNVAHTGACGTRYCGTCSVSVASQEQCTVCIMCM